MHYSFHSTPTCTFKSRHQTISKSNHPSSIPGPSHYQANKPLHHSPTIAPTSQIRNLYNNFETNPGPGTYQTHSYITDGPKRSMSQKFIDYGKHTPGPQDYQNNKRNILNKSPVFSMGNKSKSSHQIVFDHNNFKPAPTNYMHKSDLLKKQGVVIGTSLRRDLTETQKTPAPNYYMNASSAQFASNPRCLFGEDRRKTDFHNGQNTPGPAHYKEIGFVEENGTKKKGYSCRQKVSDIIAQEIAKYPAPGHYQSHLKNKKKAPQFAATLTKRSTFMDDMQTLQKPYPGPGTHEAVFAGTKYRSMSAKSFGRDTRKPLDQNEKTPGPHEYQNDKVKLLNAAPKFSVTKTTAKNEFLGVNPQNPGPGQYDAKISLVKPNCSVSEVPKELRPDFEKHRYSPGPGFYNLRGKEKGPTWKFTTEKRLAFTDQVNQGKNGTHYEIAAKVVDPPTYMNVTSKVNFDGTKSMRRTGLSSK